MNGNIYAKKLKITQAGWPDFVFDSSYHLRPLKEVETFIQKNKHLPELPSANEVERKGIDVGDNQAVLLKKVEELTLYAIEQNKKQEAQQKTIEDQIKRQEVQQKTIEEQVKMLEQMQKEMERLKKKVNKK